MSTRWYPLYQRGNPQLRVFLPNFWMKVIKPKEEIPPNMVHFHVSNEMTEYDVRNYLTKIYKLPVVAVRVEMKNGETVKTQQGDIIKEDDYKEAHVTMEKGFKFSFPEIDTRPGYDIFKKSSEQTKKTMDDLEKKYRYRPGLPTWFEQ
ncbi:39S ribosomal protein L23, mitochondrial [Frankliniella fusca]|uniref:Large ribosomal subunit protein uL23m n=1 Tax=Frankliniella fusca TaxID=407009 RepID=A0AAE1HVX7_9NEOP|nr:39S ribosomal protein L23, mitochondrial [Frankliniella fusca]